MACDGSGATTRSPSTEGRTSTSADSPLVSTHAICPVWGSGTSTPGEFAEWLADAAELEAPTWWELCLYDVQGAAILGGDVSLLASGRLDNQVSCWAATTALAESEASATVSMVVLNDHEEVGSASTTGASGPLLEHVLERLVTARGGTRDDYLRALSASIPPDQASSTPTTRRSTA